MKNYTFALLTSLVLLAGAFFSPSKANAQVACCDNGKAYLSGKCYEPIIPQSCDPIAAGMCLPVDPLNTFGCRQAINDACLRTLSVGTTVAISGDDFCEGVLDALGPAGDLINLLSAGACRNAVHDVFDDGFESNCTDEQTCNSSYMCVSKVAYELCRQIPSEDSESKAACEACAQVDAIGNVSGIWTAIGCVETDPTTMVKTLVTILVSISGGVALLMMLAAGFMFTVSEGDPKKVSEAKELMTSAVVGLLFIIFSVVILQFIGVTILQIPGFGG